MSTEFDSHRVSVNRGKSEGIFSSTANDDTAQQVEVKPKVQLRIPSHRHEHAHTHKPINICAG